MGVECLIFKSIPRSILDGYFNPLVFWYQREYLLTSKKNAGYLRLAMQKCMDHWMKIGWLSQSAIVVRFPFCSNFERPTTWLEPWRRVTPVIYWEYTLLNSYEEFCKFQTIACWYETGYSAITTSKNEGCIPARAPQGLFRSFPKVFRLGQQGMRKKSGLDSPKAVFVWRSLVALVSQPPPSFFYRLFLVKWFLG